MTHKDIIKRFYPNDCIKYLNDDESLKSDIENKSKLYINLFSCCNK